MDKPLHLFLQKVSSICITIGTLTLLLLYLQTPSTCVDPSDPNPHTRFPSSSCDFTHRSYSSPNTLHRRISSTKAWSSYVSSYTSIFRSLPLSNHSRALIVSAGPGQSVAALNSLGVGDVTAVEVVDRPPFVSKADPHNLPFFDGVFDVGLGLYLDRALFPKRYVGEIERTVRKGGFCVVVVDECGSQEMELVKRLFGKSSFVDAKNVSLAGERRTMVVMRVHTRKLRG